MLGTSFGKNYNAIFFISRSRPLHYHFVPQLDTYVSLMFGLNTGKYNSSSVSANANVILEH